MADEITGCKLIIAHFTNDKPGSVGQIGKTTTRPDSSDGAVLTSRHTFLQNIGGGQTIMSATAIALNKIKNCFSSYHQTQRPTQYPIDETCFSNQNTKAITDSLKNKKTKSGTCDSLLDSTNYGQHPQSNEQFRDCRSKSLMDPPYKQLLCDIAEQKKNKTDVDTFSKSLEEIRRKDTESNKQIEENLSKKLEMIDEEALARRKKIRQMEQEMAEEEDNFEREREREQILFEEKLYAQNIEHQKKIEQMRKERERIEKEAEQEFEEHLKRLEEQKQAFWRCIQLKLRFEEKEQEWADFIRTLRETLRKPKTQCSRLNEELERSFGDVEDDDFWIEQQYEKLHSSTLEAYRVFYNVFFYLQNISKTAEDRVFLRILMKSAAEISNKLCGVLGKLYYRDVSHNQKIDFFKNINYFDVPNTRKLKELSKDANFEDYLDIEEPLRYSP